MCSALSNLVWLSGDWQEELELWWKLILSVKSIREVYSSDSAVSVNLNSIQKQIKLASAAGFECSRASRYMEGRLT